MVLDKTLAMFEEVANAHNRRKISGGEKMSGIDNVNHPKHYKLPGGGETIDFIGAVCGAGVDEYYRGNILKYVCRYKEKGGAESLKKARWYLDKLIAFQEAKEELEMEAEA